MNRVVLQPRPHLQHAAPAFIDVTFLPSCGMRLQGAQALLSNKSTVLLPFATGSRACAMHGLLFDAPMRIDDRDLLQP